MQTPTKSTRLAAISAYHGTAIIMLTVFLTYFMNQLNNAPLLVAVTIHLAGCLLLPKKIIPNKLKMKLAISGIVAIFFCYFLMTLFLN